MEECMTVQHGSLLPWCEWAQSSFSGFEEYAFPVLRVVAMQALTMLYESLLASEALVAEFAHDRWRCDCLPSGLYDAWWHGVHAGRLLEGSAVGSEHW